MNQKIDLIRISNDFNSRIVDYGIEVITYGSDDEINRLFKYYPEFLYHQYTNESYWFDIAWQYLIGSINDDELLLNRLQKLKDFDYEPSGKFREKIISSMNPSLIQRYIETFENDTSKSYTDSSGKEFSSLLGLSDAFFSFCDIEGENLNPKEVVKILMDNSSTIGVNTRDKYGYIVEGLIKSPLISSQKELLINFIETKNVDLNVKVECRKGGSLRYMEAKGYESKIKPHSIFGDKSIEIPLIQSVLFELSDTYKLSPRCYEHNIGNQLRFIKDFLPVFKDRIEDKGDIVDIVNFVDIDVITDAFSDIL